MPLIKVSVKRKYTANMQIIFQSKGSKYMANMQVKEVMRSMQIAKPTYVKKSTYTLESIKLTPLQLQPKCKSHITLFNLKLFLRSVTTNAKKSCLQVTGYASVTNWTIDNYFSSVWSYCQNLEEVHQEDPGPTLHTVMCQGTASWTVDTNHEGCWRILAILGCTQDSCLWRLGLWKSMRLWHLSFTAISFNHISTLYEFTCIC